jgi:uncharacterized protein
MSTTEVLLVARIKPNQDLATSLTELCKSNGFKSAIIRGVVGSLVEANLSRGRGENRSVARVPDPVSKYLAFMARCVSQPVPRSKRLSRASSLEMMVRFFFGRFLAAGNLSFITIEASIQEWIEEDDDAISA